MTILLPNIATEQTIKFIPTKNLVVDRIDFLDEQSNTTQTATLGTQNEESFYQTIGATIELKDESIYMMYFYNGSTLVFSDKVFATDQPIESFSINDGIYLNAPSSANQYIVYGQ